MITKRRIVSEGIASLACHAITTQTCCPLAQLDAGTAGSGSADNWDVVHVPLPLLDGKRLFSERGWGTGEPFPALQTHLQSRVLPHENPRGTCRAPTIWFNRLVVADRFASLRVPR